MGKIRVGLSATLSGKYSLQGKESFNGLKLWADNLNGSGGLKLENQSKKTPVELLFYDDISDPKNTEKITKKLITEDKADIILGPYSSSLTMAAARISESFNRVLWNYGGSTDEIAESGFKKVVSAITPASRYFHPFLELINEQNIQTDVAVVFASDSGFATEVAKGAMAHCKVLGLGYEKYAYTSGKGDFKEIVDRISSKKIKYVLGVGRFEDDVDLARYLKGFNTCLVAAGIDEFKNQLNLDSEGFFSVTQWEPGVLYSVDFGPDPGDFTGLYETKYGNVPDYTSAQSFNMGVILEKFIVETGSLKEDNLMDKITGSRFCTFYGDFEINSVSGIQAGHKTLVTQWQNGRREIIYPSAHKSSQFSFV